MSPSFVRLRGKNKSDLTPTLFDSIFAQNNGVIALTRCANRKAGYACACFMILYGVLGKLSGVFLSIPNPVLGGVTTFLFASVVASGIKVVSYVKFTRKDRFILAAAGALGFGNMLVPNWATYLFADVKNASAGLQGLFTSIVIVISTPYLITGIVASLLNLIIPEDAPDDATIAAGATATSDISHAEEGITGDASESEFGEKDHVGAKDDLDPQSSMGRTRVQVLDA